MIVVFGTVCLDRIRRVPHLPEPGGYVEASEVHERLGGEAANTAVHLQRWGIRPTLVSNPLGGDETGADIRRRVAAQSLNLVELSIPEGSDGPICDVLVTPDGERTMFGSGFSTLDGRFPLTSLPLEAGGLITVESNFARSSLEAARIAAEAGMRTYLMDMPERARCDFWQASEPNATLERAEDLARLTGAFVILTRGAHGLVAGGPGLPARAYPAFRAPSVVDTTGAGDAFRAGMLYGLDRGWTLPACLQFAAAAGALSVGDEGAAERTPCLRRIGELIVENPQIALAYA